MRVGDLVEHQHHALLRQRLDVGRGQGIGFREQALVHGIGGQQPVDVVRADDLRRNAGGDVLFREATRGVFGEQQLLEPALRVLQRHGHGVPAIEHGWAVMVAVLPDRPPPAGPALVERPFVKRLAAPALETRLSISIGHGKLVSRVPDNGNLA